MPTSLRGLRRPNSGGARIAQVSQVHPVCSCPCSASAKKSCRVLLETVLRRFHIVPRCCGVPTFPAFPVWLCLRDVVSSLSSSLSPPTAGVVRGVITGQPVFHLRKRGVSATHHSGAVYGDVHEDLPPFSRRSPYPIVCVCIYNPHGAPLWPSRRTGHNGELHATRAP